MCDIYFNTGPLLLTNEQSVHLLFIFISHLTKALNEFWFLLVELLQSNHLWIGIMLWTLN